LDAARIAAPKVSIRRADGSKANVVIGGTGMSGPIFLDDRSFRDFAFRKWHAGIHEMKGAAGNSQLAASNAAQVTAKILERIESAQ
jgi:adenosylhomocysteine nucleosidase